VFKFTRDARLESDKELEAYLLKALQAIFEHSDYENRDCLLTSPIELILSVLSKGIAYDHVVL
jgi:hypothetical protein